MSPEVRTYLEQVVQEIEPRLRRRGWGQKKQWEQLVLKGAKDLLKADDASHIVVATKPRYPELGVSVLVRTSDSDLNAAVRRHTHAGLE